MKYETRWVAMLINVVLTPDKPIPKSNFRDWNWCELWVLLVGVAKNSSDPRQASKSNFRDGTYCELWVLLPLCPLSNHGEGGGMGTGDVCWVSLAAVRNRRAK